MEFSFKKYTKEEPKKEELKTTENSELTQEEFDEQIIQEAKKLKTNIEQLKTEIDQAGGVEKFKEYFEKVTGWVGNDKNIHNKAGDSLRHTAYEIQSKNREAKMKALATTVCYGISAILISLGINHSVSVNHPVNLISAMAAIAFIVGTITMISSMKDKFEARKLNRIKQKEELKFKMTGTEVK